MFRKAYREAFTRQLHPSKPKACTRAPCFNNSCAIFNLPYCAAKYRNENVPILFSKHRLADTPLCSKMEMVCQSPALIAVSIGFTLAMYNAAGTSRPLCHHLIWSRARRRFFTNADIFFRCFNKLSDGIWWPFLHQSVRFF